jgi:hypothetical protein
MRYWFAVATALTLCLITSVPPAKAHYSVCQPRGGGRPYVICPGERCATFDSIIARSSGNHPRCPRDSGSVPPIPLASIPRCTTDTPPRGTSSEMRIIPPQRTGEACIALTPGRQATRSWCLVSDDNFPGGKMCSYLDDPGRQDVCLLGPGGSSDGAQISSLWWNETTRSDGARQYCVTFRNLHPTLHRYLWLYLD